MLRQWWFLERCAARYGEMFTVRITHESPWVMLSRPDAVKQVFTGSEELLHAGEGNQILLPVLGENSVLLLDEGAHREQRRVLMPAFHGRQVQQYGEAMTTIASREIARWPRGRAVRLLPRMRALTLEVILQTVFGLRRGARLDRLRTELTRLLNLVSGPPAQIVMATVPPQRLQRFVGLRLLLSRVDRWLYAEITERRRAEDLGEREDVLSLLLRARHEDGTPLTDRELRDQLMTLLLAGHETTATALSWAVERVLRHPEIHQRLAEEIQAGGHDYLDAVIKETLRLRPVISLVLRYLSEPMTLGEVTLPAGVTVTPSSYLLHRRPEIYPEPHRFHPERFLHQRPGPYTWIPFGGGVRRCLGAAFAEYEMRVVLSQLFGNLHMRPLNTKPERAARRSVTIVPQRGATVVLG